jgi:hypothetical protein
VVSAISVEPSAVLSFRIPENGHFLALSIDWETFSELAEDPDPEIWLGGN